MNECSTLNQLVLYLYNETELTDSVLIQAAIDHDDEIAETFQNLIETDLLIQHALICPSPKLRNNILNYARATAPKV
jgi:hypothetical protein